MKPIQDIDVLALIKHEVELLGFGNVKLVKQLAHRYPLQIVIPKLEELADRQVFSYLSTGGPNDLDSPVRINPNSSFVEDVRRQSDDLVWYLATQGMYRVRQRGDVLIGLRPMLYTTALCWDAHEGGVETSYCFHKPHEALRTIDAWCDGLPAEQSSKEPPGEWHRRTGRGARNA